MNRTTEEPEKSHDPQDYGESDNHITNGLNRFSIAGKSKMAGSPEAPGLGDDMERQQRCDEQDQRVHVPSLVEAARRCEQARSRHPAHRTRLCCHEAHRARPAHPRIHDEEREDRRNDGQRPQPPETNTRRGAVVVPRLTRQGCRWNGSRGPIAGPPVVSDRFLVVHVRQPGICQALLSSFWRRMTL